MSFIKNTPLPSDPVSSFPAIAERQNTAMIEGDGFNLEKVVLTDRKQVPGVPTTPQPEPGIIQVFSATSDADPKLRLYAIDPDGNISDIISQNKYTRREVGLIVVEQIGKTLVMSGRVSALPNSPPSFASVSFPVSFASAPIITTSCNDAYSVVVRPIPNKPATEGFGVVVYEIPSASPGPNAIVDWVARGLAP